MRLAAAALLLLAACSEEPASGPQAAGPMLEKAAIARGLVRDPDDASLTGLFARGADRLCIAASQGEGRIGVSLDCGEGNGCSGAGSVERSGDELMIDLGQGCRIEAGYDGRLIRFPGALPAKCSRLCQGNAALAGLIVERVSSSPGEAAAFRDRRGQFPCANEAAE